MADPLSAFGRPLHTSRLPGRLLTRAWDHGLTRAPAGFDIVQSVSLASPQLRRSSRERLVVTVHDVAWRRYPEATTRRGARWHEAALRRPAVAEESTLSVLLAAEQLRRRVPGGIGAYARGLLGGLAVAAKEGDRVEVALLASRGPRGVADQSNSRMRSPISPPPDRNSGTEDLSKGFDRSMPLI